MYIVITSSLISRSFFCHYVVASMFVLNFVFTAAVSNRVQSECTTVKVD